MGAPLSTKAVLNRIKVVSEGCDNSGQWLPCNRCFLPKAVAPRWHPAFGTIGCGCDACGGLGARWAYSCDALIVPEDSKKAAAPALYDALVETTDALEAEINARYPDEAAGRSTYPTMRRSYDRDMSTVIAARAVLSRSRGESGQ